MKHLFRLDLLIITAQIFIIIWLFKFIPITMGFLDPVGKALTDFDIYDIVFSRLREEPVFDDRIVLVNIGDLDRRGIAMQLRNINRFSPRAVCIDALFTTHRDTRSDSLLADELAKCNNLVLAARLSQYNSKEDRYDSVITPLPLFVRYARYGYANMPEDEKGGYRTIRTFRPSALSSNGEELAFAVSAARIFDSSAVQVLLKRDSESELINFRGNIAKFYALDTYQALDTSLDLHFIKDKIILMGYMGQSFRDASMTDIFFTPLNEKYAGRTFPDMYGVVIHANIISMILSGNYIDQMPRFLSVIFAWVLTYFNVLILTAVKKNLKDWFGGLTKLILTSQALSNLIIGLWIFNNYHYKINLTLALIAIFLVPTSIDLYQNYIERGGRILYVKTRYVFSKII